MAEVESSSTFVDDSDKVVKLGFLEDTDTKLLKSHFFPSKVGGKPSWLSLDPLPDTEQFACRCCKGMLTFLMQVYAPLQMREDSFHRTIFVFICTKPSCSQPNDSKCFKVMRSQLPLKNTFYSEEPPAEDIEDNADLNEFPSADKFNSLCNVCGIKGSKKCSQCKKVSYCCKDHQVADWKSGHKGQCSQTQAVPSKSSNPSRSQCNIVFKEAELVTEDENNSDSEDESNSKDEAECLKEYEKLMKLPELKGLEGQYKTEDLEQSATAETEDDRQFLQFKKRIRSEPTQVLRYNRGGKPLWISAHHQSSPEDIPNCLCGATRTFEFQIMPQLLRHLALDSLEASVDWGTLAVYTCTDSCALGDKYQEEFIWKQDIGENNL